MPQVIIFGIIKSLHDLFTALWIGGLLTTALTFMPSFKKYANENPSSKKLLAGYQGRLRIIALISIVVLWITGILLGRQSAAYDGFLSFSTTYATLVSIKHLIILVMILISVYRGFILGRKVESFTPQQQKLYAGFLFVNTLLGVVVLFLSGISATLG